MCLLCADSVLSLSLSSIILLLFLFLECDSAHTSAYNSSYSAYLLGFLLLLSSSLWAFSMRKSAFFFLFRVGSFVAACSQLQNHL